MGLAGKDVAMQVACMTTDNLKYNQLNVIYLDIRGGQWNSGYMVKSISKQKKESRCQDVGEHTNINQYDFYKCNNYQSLFQ